ncbi:galactosylceramide sulfotransferase-like [Amphiura filiformis]|uniref:galactosylceramide sulfotransferase-like n=1 Tax=Amphiura filiformis TaxID=82378 RepID=UPI003B224E5E
MPTIPVVCTWRSHVSPWSFLAYATLFCMFFLIYFIAFAARWQVPNKAFGSFTQIDTEDDTDLVYEKKRWEQVPPPPTKDKTQSKKGGKSHGHDRDCQPHHRVVYVKVPKTGSGTVASILDRYGWSHDLTFAVPKHENNFDPPFNKSQVYRWKSFENGFDMLTNHAGYNRYDMLAMVPNATFLTTIRDPVKQFESAFTYFGYADQLGLTNEKDPMEAFLRGAEEQEYVMKLSYGQWMSRNGQIKYLGLDRKKQEMPFYIERRIKQLSHELDLVILTDYLDESLLLLRRLLCWTMDDILYISKNVRSTSYRYNVTNKVADMIRKWNSADMRLYDYFNRTLWNKVERYGSHFQKDLKEFRRRKEKLNQQCIEEMIEDPGESKRVVELIVKKENEGKCHDWILTPRQFIKMKRHRMRHLAMEIGDYPDTT